MMNEYIILESLSKILIGQWSSAVVFFNIGLSHLIQCHLPLPAHPNVKLFISHCGLLSTQEAIYHGKPVLGLPVFGDQPRNADKLKNQGIGRMLVWEDLTEDILLKEITELMTNPR